MLPGGGADVKTKCILWVREPQGLRSRAQSRKESQGTRKMKRRPHVVSDGERARLHPDMPFIRPKCTVGKRTGIV